MFGALGSIFSFLSGIAPAVASIWTAKTDSSTTEYVSMSETERAEYTASQQAQVATNTAKVQHGTSRIVQILTFMFGVPPAIHWGWTYFTATFPALGFATDPLHGAYADSEVKIAMSFFILTPTLPLVQAVTARLFRGKGS